MMSRLSRITMRALVQAVLWATLLLAVAQCSGPRSEPSSERKSALRLSRVLPWGRKEKENPNAVADELSALRAAIKAATCNLSEIVNKAKTSNGNIEIPATGDAEQTDIVATSGNTEATENTNAAHSTNNAQLNNDQTEITNMNSVILTLGEQTQQLIEFKTKTTEDLKAIVTALSYPISVTTGTDSEKSDAETETREQSLSTLLKHKTKNDPFYDIITRLKTLAQKNKNEKQRLRTKLQLLDQTETSLRGLLLQLQLMNNQNDDKPPDDKLKEDEDKNITSLIKKLQRQLTTLGLATKQKVENQNKDIDILKHNNEALQKEIAAQKQQNEGLMQDIQVTKKQVVIHKNN